MNTNIDSNDMTQLSEMQEKLFPGSKAKTIERLGGLTNCTYHVTMIDGQQYVFRLPGEGTEEIINRNYEKISNELACTLQIDAELIYFDEETGLLKSQTSQIPLIIMDKPSTKVK